VTEWLLLAASLVLMLACGVFVAAEFSFVTVDRATVERAASSGDKGAQGTLTALRSLSTQLSGAQLGITITNLAIGYLAEPAIGSLLRGPLGDVGLEGGAQRGVAYGIALVVSTVVTMLVGELVPKNFALALPQRTAALTQLPQRAFTKAMAWPIRVLNGMANSILRALDVEPQEELRSARSPVELRSLVLRSAVEGAIDDAGEINGAEAMRRYARDWLDTFDDITFVPEELFDVGDGRVVVGVEVLERGVEARGGRSVDGVAGFGPIHDHRRDRSAAFRSYAAGVVGHVASISVVSSRRATSSAAKSW
jgi:hypothetical protein